MSAARKPRNDLADMREALDAMIAKGPPIPSPLQRTTFRQAAQIVRVRGIEFEQEIAMRIQEFTKFEGAIIKSIDVTHELRERWNPIMKRMQTFCEYAVVVQFRIPEEGEL